MAVVEESEGNSHKIYRKGKRNPGNLRPRPIDNGHISFRSSLSNPILSQDCPVFGLGDDYIVVDASRLPDKSIIRDDDPPGHVSVVGVSEEQLRNAVVDSQRLPK